MTSTPTDEQAGYSQKLLWRYNETWLQSFFNCHPSQTQKLRIISPVVQYVLCVCQYKDRVRSLKSGQNIPKRLWSQPLVSELLEDVPIPSSAEIAFGLKQHLRLPSHPASACHGISLPFLQNVPSAKRHTDWFTYDEIPAFLLSFSCPSECRLSTRKVSWSVRQK